MQLNNTFAQKKINRSAIFFNASVRTFCVYPRSDNGTHYIQSEKEVFGLLANVEYV